MKKKIGLFMLLFAAIAALVCFAIPGHAQDVTGVIPSTTASGLPVSWIKYITLALLVYDALIRIIPTKGNYAIIGRVMAFLKWLATANNTKA